MKYTNWASEEPKNRQAAGRSSDCVEMRQVRALHSEVCVQLRTFTALSNVRVDVGRAEVVLVGH